MRTCLKTSANEKIQNARKREHLQKKRKRESNNEQEKETKRHALSYDDLHSDECSKRRRTESESSKECIQKKRSNNTQTAKRHTQMSIT